MTMKKRAYASALIAVIALSAAWTGLMLYRQRPALPVAGLLHRSTVDPTVDRGGHSRGIVQVNLLRQIMADRARAVPAEPETGHKVATQSHPLLDHPAPPVVLNDAWGKTWNLHEEARGGPVVVVFYLGSTCMACVTHLTELDVAMARFTRAARAGAGDQRRHPGVFAGTYAQVRRFADPALERCRPCGLLGLRRLEGSRRGWQRRRRGAARLRSSSTVMAWFAGPMSAIVRSPTSRRS